MKNLLFIILSAITFTSSAQNNQGVIQYTEKMNMHKHMTGERERFKEFVPEFTELKMELWFNEKAAKYASSSSFKPETYEEQSGGMKIVMKMAGSESEYFFDLEKGTSVEKKDFMSRTFIIKDEKEQPAWKISPEQKQILGYPCMKATMEKDSSIVEAWFTPQIPVKAGPKSFHQLPGMVLAVTVNGDDMIIEATNIELKEIEASSIMPPKKGKKVTQEEFDKIVKEKMEEMKEQYGSRGGNFHMMMR